MENCLDTYTPGRGPICLPTHSFILTLIKNKENDWMYTEMHHPLGYAGHLVRNPSAFCSSNITSASDPFTQQHKAAECRIRSSYCMADLHSTLKPRTGQHLCVCFDKNQQDQVKKSQYSTTCILQLNRRSRSRAFYWSYFLNCR